MNNEQHQAKKINAGDPSEGDVSSDICQNA